MNYPGYVSTPTSNLTTMKLRVNITISEVKSIDMCMDVKYFYLNSQMDRDKNSMIRISMIPQEFVEK